MSVNELQAMSVVERDSLKLEIDRRLVEFRQGIVEINQLKGDLNKQYAETSRVIETQLSELTILRSNINTAETTPLVPTSPDVVPGNSVPQEQPAKTPTEKELQSEIGSSDTKCASQYQFGKNIYNKPCYRVTEETCTGDEQGITENNIHTCYYDPGNQARKTQDFWYIISDMKRASNTGLASVVYIPIAFVYMIIKFIFWLTLFGAIVAFVIFKKKNSD